MQARKTPWSILNSGFLILDSTRKRNGRLLAPLIIFCAVMGISLLGVQTRAAELSTIGSDCRKMGSSA